MEAPGTPERKTPYVSVKLTIPARDVLRDSVPEVTTDAGRRVNQSEVLLAMHTVAFAHRNELIAALTRLGAPE